MSSVHILYFASVREQAGLSEETVMPPPDVTDVRSLVGWLRGRGGRPGAALADLRHVRIAVNQEHASLEHAVGPDDEVAFFPPVTGGRPQ